MYLTLKFWLKFVMPEHPILGVGWWSIIVGWPLGGDFIQRCCIGVGCFIKGSGERDGIWSKVINTIPMLAIPTNMYRTGTYISIEMSMFHTDLNTGCTNHLLANSGITGKYPKKKKKLFLFFSFLIFEFL